MCDRIDPRAEIGEDFSHGIGTVVEEDVRIGVGVTLGNHVTVCCGTKVGDGVTVADFAVLGRKPKLAMSSTAKATVDMPGLTVAAGASIGPLDTLIAGTGRIGVLRRSLTDFKSLIHTHGNIAGLFVNRCYNRTGMAVKTVFRTIVADI
jgi:acyl-[acyl carrier protein]--UDP-N-acetylglucosamine O-acyltransferase